MKSSQAIIFILFISLDHNLTAGQIVGWGDNIAGQATGVQTSESSSSAMDVTIGGESLSNVVSIAAGYAHSLALIDDGTVIGWGFNRSGQAIGFPTTNPENTNGVVTIAGNILRNVTAVAAGGSHSMALKRDGTVVCWGDIGALNGLSNVTAIASGLNYNMAVNNDGTVVEWDNSNSQTVIGLSNVISVATGSSYNAPSLALKNDGSVVKFMNYSSDIPESARSNVLAIAVGAGNCFALRKDGLLVAWPYSSDSGTNLLKDVVAISAGGRHCLALKEDGSVFAWGNNSSHQADVPAGLSNVVAIAAGNNFSLAITTNAAVAKKFRQK